MYTDTCVHVDVCLIGFACMQWYFGWLLHSFACLFVRLFVCLAKWMCVFSTFPTINEHKNVHLITLNYANTDENINLAKNGAHTQPICAAAIPFFLSSMAVFIVFLVIFGCFISKRNMCRMEKHSSSSHTMHKCRVRETR